MLEPLMLSVYQQRAIFRRMLALARSLAHNGMPRAEWRKQVCQLRDSLLATYLEDITMRCRRGHLR